MKNANKEKLENAIETLDKIVRSDSASDNSKVYAAANMASLIKTYEERFGTPTEKQPLRAVKNF